MLCINRIMYFFKYKLNKILHHSKNIKVLNKFEEQINC